MVQFLGLLFWLIVIPYCIGLIPAGFLAEEKRNPGLIFLAGYFTMWALFGLVTIPVVVWVRYDNFILASNLFMTAGILSAAAGVGITWFRKKRRRAAGRTGREGSVQSAGRTGREGSVQSAGRTGREGSAQSAGRTGHGDSLREIRIADRVRAMSWAERIEWLLFFILLGFQLYKAAAYASFDGDDAYYVVASLIAQQADTMYTILPLTGRHTGLDIRHAMAVFPMWVAFVASKSRIHATILSHSVLPLFLIPLTYLLYYEIGRLLFGGAARKGLSVRKGRKKHYAAIERDETGSGENLPIFLILMAVFQIFGNVSLYTNETFFLTRTWQGKAVAGSLVIPALLWLFLLLYDSVDREKEQGKGETKAGIWFLLVCVNMAAGICSSIAVFLVSVLMAVTALCLAFVERDFKVLFKMGAVCLPNAVYVLIYLIVGYGYLLR